MPSWKRALPPVLLGGLFLLTRLRCWVFVAYSRAHFDSDQAVIGLMAKDLATGRAFAWFTYGRTYMLAVSAFLSAPLFALFGTSVTLLKVPLVAMNLAVVAMLWVGLRREPAATPARIALSILPFAIPSVVVSSRIVEQAGGNIEPFVFIVAGFLLRANPIWLGINFGVGFLNREFALIGLVALVLMELVQGTLLSRWKAWLTSSATIAATVILGRFVASRAANYFGSPALVGHSSWENVSGLLSQQLPTMIGGQLTALSAYNITSTLWVGHTWLCIVVALWLALVVVLGVRVERSELNGMPTYLILVAGGQLLAYMLLSPGSTDPMLVRYTLLVLLGLCGITAHAMRRPALRAPTVFVVALLSLAQLRDHVALIHEYAIALPPDDREQLAEELVRRDVQYAVANDWVSYHVSFLTDERVIANSNADQRIQRYNELISKHAAEVTTIAEQPCAGAARVAHWYSCGPAVSLSGRASVGPEPKQR